MRNIPPVKAIIFDIGNVLVRWNPHNAFAPLFKNRAGELDYFLNEICSPAWHDRHDQGITFAENITALQKKFPEHHDMIAAYDTLWDDMFDGVIKGSVEILRQLHALSYPLCALSNFPAEKYPAFRQKHDFMALFQDVVISGEEKVTKPDLRIYQILLDRCPARPQHCLFIDDRMENITAARNVGLQTHLFTGADNLTLYLLDREILTE